MPLSGEDESMHLCSRCVCHTRIAVSLTEEIRAGEFDASVHKR